mmetsp:Transcript_106535/g.206326  ORF Transcript_106535/g.206326 Transcript_106535/m.206326 type:complete len:604 (+) Transcript_106535:116-1927(+)
MAASTFLEDGDDPVFESGVDSAGGLPFSAPPKRRSNSIQKLPWELVEVSSSRGASVPASPSIPLLQTPGRQQQVSARRNSARGVRTRGEPWEEGEAVYWDRVSVDGGKNPQEEENGFEPAFFVGEWQDNLGHRITVVPAGGGRSENSGSSGSRGGRGRRGVASNRLAFLATLSKAGVPDKRFNVSRDRGRVDWTCGNGVLEKNSTIDKLNWRSSDGRISSWSRVPPEGPVYFDAPPPMQEVPPPPQGTIYFDPPPEGSQAAQVYEPPPTGPVYFDPPPGQSLQFDQPGTPRDAGGSALNQQWLQLPPGNAPASGPFYFLVQQPVDWNESSQVVQEGQESQESQVNVQEPAANVAGTNATWNTEAPEFVPTWNTEAPAAAAAPQASAEATPETLAAPTLSLTPASPGPSPKPVPQQRIRPSPKLNPARTPILRASWGRTPTPSPKMGPLLPPPAQGFVPPALAPAPQPIVVQLSEESEELRASGGRLEWSVPETWGSLCKYPKDKCATSPSFSIRRAPNMQLAFYPGGSRTAEAGQCTVALTRSPESAGIKFEFSVNGRSIGRKVCLGRRYQGDYPRPFSDSEETNLSRVTVCMHIMEVLGPPG